MGDFKYSMITKNDGTTVGAHSITINGLNTWKSWHMAPKSRPFVVAPQVKTEYVDVPGADGALDYTEVLTGKPRYANRTGQWDFIVDNGNDYVKWCELYSDILKKLHGKYFDRIVLEDDPDYKWKGRLAVTGQFGNKDYSSISIAYNLDPYKRPIDDLGSKQWLWNELFTNTIFYGNFSVNGFKARNIINDDQESVTVNVEVSYQMDAIPYDGTEKTQYSMLSGSFDRHIEQYTNRIHLNTGENEITLQPGDNYFFFVGNGLVKVEQERGKLL